MKGFIRTLTVSLFALAMLAACGGGASTPTPTPTPTPARTVTPEPTPTPVPGDVIADQVARAWANANTGEIVDEILGLLPVAEPLLNQLLEDATLRV